MNDIINYNEEDCVSTHDLRNFLTGIIDLRIMHGFLKQKMRTDKNIEG